MKKLCLQILNLFFIITFTTSCNKISDEIFEKTENPPAFPLEKWVQVSDPSKFNWSIEKLKEVEEFAKSIKTDALMIIDDGRLIETYGNTDKKYYVASIRKSYLSVLFGYYIEDKINLNSTLKDLGIDDKNPTLNDAELKAKVYHLLTSTSGIYHKLQMIKMMNCPKGIANNQVKYFFITTGILMHWVVFSQSKLIEKFMRITQIELQIQ